MNKYEEALGLLCGANLGDSLAKIMLDTGLDNVDPLIQLNIRIKIESYSKTLKELIDKATPKKVIVSETDCDKCPTCGSYHISTGYSDDWDNWIDIAYSHCEDCDQKLDWTKDE